MLNHKNLSFKAAMRSLSDPAGYFPASKEIQGVSFNEVEYRGVTHQSDTWGRTELIKDVYIIWYEFGEQITCIITAWKNYDKLCVLFRGDKTKCAIRSFTGMKEVKKMFWNDSFSMRSFSSLSQRNSFSLPRKSMVLNYNKARIKRENQLIDVLNIELDVRDINPQNLSDFHNT